MAKSQAPSSSERTERYEDILRRLDEVVRLLESSEVTCRACEGAGTVEDERPCGACGGEGRTPLPLEESLKAFEEGIGLVRRGEAKLAEAEKRVEVLLNAETDTREPFDPEQPRAGLHPEVEVARERPAAEKSRGRKALKAEDEDVPF